MDKIKMNIRIIKNQSKSHNIINHMVIKLKKNIKKKQITKHHNKNHIRPLKLISLVEADSKKNQQNLLHNRLLSNLHSKLLLRILSIFLTIHQMWTRMITNLEKISSQLVLEILTLVHLHNKIKPLKTEALNRIHNRVHLIYLVQSKWDNILFKKRTKKTTGTNHK